MKKKGRLDRGGREGKQEEPPRGSRRKHEQVS